MKGGAGRQRGHRGLPVLCFLASALLGFAVAAYATGATFVHDELGRLIAAVDPSGNAAKYSYDAVGNLLATTTYNSTSGVLIFAFTPNNGPATMSVTIYGDNFSTTPSQNTVKFNGTAATVVSSTISTIVTSVPGGATSGPISVTTLSSPWVSSAPVLPPRQ